MNVTKIKARQIVSQMLRQGLGLRLGNCSITLEETCRWGIKRVYQLSFLNNEYDLDGSKPEVPSFESPIKEYEWIDGEMTLSIEDYIDAPGLVTFSSNRLDPMRDVIRQLLQQGAQEVTDMFYVIQYGEEKWKEVCQKAEENEI